MSPAKFGVETDEFEDGITVFGKAHSSLHQGASVHCYDDHRVAMAFSVLGCIIAKTVIEEKRCVEKTWPNFWDDLQNKVCQFVHTKSVELIRSTDRNCSRRCRTRNVSCLVFEDHVARQKVGAPNLLDRYARSRQDLYRSTSCRSHSR